MYFRYSLGYGTRIYPSLSVAYTGCIMRNLPYFGRNFLSST